MTNRNTASFLALDAVTLGRPGAASLRRRFVVGAGVATAVIVGLAIWGGSAISTHFIDAQAALSLDEAARRSSLLVDRLLAQRDGEAELVASSPSVVAAALAGGEASRARGMVGRPAAELDREMAGTNSLQVGGGSLGYLRSLLEPLQAVDVMVTDRYGYNAVITGPTSDFVQSDEAWWQRAWATGRSAPEATADEASGHTVVEIARAIQSGGTKVGVVKVKFALTGLDTALVQGSAGTRTRVDIIDAQGRVLASSTQAERFKPIEGAEYLGQATGDSVVRFAVNGTRYRAAVDLANHGSWRLVAMEDDASVLAPYASVRMALWGGMAALLVGLLTLLFSVDRFVRRRISEPASELASVAEAVAAGDLSQQVRQMHADDEIGRLGRAVSAMVMELRRLAGTMSSSSHDTAIMSAEITAGSEEMAASAGEIASTASDLSEQASTMAVTIQKLTTSADELATLAGSLNRGAHEGVERNVQLRALAVENRTKLDESAAALEALTTQVRAGSDAVERLAAASAEVKTFVALVQKLARQSKLLALNAAMEAARAGEHGEGFAVVAAEVRRLAAMSSDAGERTQQIVADVLSGIEQSRATSDRSVVTVREVAQATQHASRSFGMIEVAVRDAEGWTNAIEQAAGSTNRVAEEVRSRVVSLAAGIDSFAAAMEQVAASSEEQSASTEQIAAAAGTLSAAAERLSAVVRGLRLEGSASGDVAMSGVVAGHAGVALPEGAGLNVAVPEPARS